ncbi:hypothetical protein SBDP2_530001 [Syntrophobacter sp. SbD2]|nr:hypothetical protein SBDP2_530001 [Syntrophobacter sp. SbD2]
MPKLFAAVTAKLGKGEITPSEIKTLIDLAETIHKSLEVVELEQRIGALEERAKPGEADKMTLKVCSTLHYSLFLASRFLLHASCFYLPASCFLLPASRSCYHLLLRRI